MLIMGGVVLGVSDLNEEKFWGANSVESYRVNVDAGEGDNVAALVACIARSGGVLSYLHSIALITIPRVHWLTDEKSVI